MVENSLNEKFYNSFYNSVVFIGVKKRASKRIKAGFSLHKMNTINLDGTNQIAKAVAKNRNKHTTYISMGGYLATAKSTNDLDKIICLDRIVVDIDPCDHKNIFSHDQKELLIDVLTYYHIAPNFIIDSGHGLQAVFLFEPESHVNQSFRRTYNRAVKNICDELNNLISEYVDVKIDKLTVNSLYRLPGTYNATAGRYAEVIYAAFDITDKRVSFSELCDELDVPLIKKGVNKSPSLKKSSVSESSKDVSAENNRFDSFVSNLKHDYITLIHKFRIGEGCRNSVLYCFARNIQKAYRNQSIVLNIVDDLNHFFEVPLPLSEVRTICKSAHKDYTEKGKIYSFISQIEFIERHTNLILSLDMDQSDYKLPISLEAKEQRNIASKKAARERYRKKLKETRRAAKSDRISKIIQMHKSGIPKKQIARLTGVSIITVRKYIQSEANIAPAVLFFLQACTYTH